MDCWPHKTSNLNITHWALGYRNGPFSLFSDNLSAVAHSHASQQLPVDDIVLPFKFLYRGKWKDKSRNISQKRVK